MPIAILDLGTESLHGEDGDSNRASNTKVNANFAYLASMLGGVDANGNLVDTPVLLTALSMMAQINAKQIDISVTSLDTLASQGTYHYTDAGITYVLFNLRPQLGSLPWGQIRLSSNGYLSYRTKLNNAWTGWLTAATMNGAGKVPLAVTADSASSVPFVGITDKPTTLSGYGITDAINSSAIGAASGVAPLDANSLIPSIYLPSYVDDVIEVANYDALPSAGETGKIYVTVDNNRIYRWTGSGYAEVSSAGTADAAVKLLNARTISVTGDGTWSVSFDGSANVSATMTLANTGVAAGNYGSALTVPTFTVDSKGRLTAASTVNIQTASTSQAGVVQLNSATNSSLDTQAATPAAVKAAYDLAMSALTEKVYVGTNPAIAFANGTIQQITLAANGTLTCDVANGQTVSVLIPATSYTLALTGFTIGNNFTAISSTKPTTLLISNINGTKMLYGTIGA